MFSIETKFLKRMKWKDFLIQITTLYMEKMEYIQEKDYLQFKLLKKNLEKILVLQKINKV